MSKDEKKLKQRPKRAGKLLSSKGKELLRENALKLTFSPSFLEV
ncbi:MAG: hypothetical protein ACPLSP_00355 [Fervidicoccus fontis]